MVSFNNLAGMVQAPYVDDPAAIEPSNIQRSRTSRKRKEKEEDSDPIGICAVSSIFLL